LAESLSRGWDFLQKKKKIPKFFKNFDILQISHKSLTTVIFWKNLQIFSKISIISKKNQQFPIFFSKIFIFFTNLHIIQKSLNILQNFNNLEKSSHSSNILENLHILQKIFKYLNNPQLSPEKSWPILTSRSLCFCKYN
jgi:hypothetical protein